MHFGFHLSFLCRHLDKISKTMKCSWCAERKGHTRCEGCQQFYCLPCLNKHHNELMTQFELLMNVQKELKKTFEQIETNWENNRSLPCFVDISRWEETWIERIRQVAQQTRNTANEMMATNMVHLRHRLDQIAFDLEERREQSNYLDNDILVIKNQLEQLNQNIQRVEESIRIVPSMSNQIDFDSFLRVTSDKSMLEHEEKLLGSPANMKTDQEKLWTSFRRMIKHRTEKNDPKSKVLPSRKNLPAIYEPIILTSFTSKMDRSTEMNRSTDAVHRFALPLEQRLGAIRSRSCHRDPRSPLSTSDA